MHATRITHLYSSKTEGPMARMDPETSQMYNKGNVAILLHESVQLHDVLPPSFHDIHEAMCAVFVGSNMKLTVDNIKNLSLILVSKSRVCTMIDFLLKENAWYCAAGLKFSQENVDDLFEDSVGDDDEGVPCAVELCHLPLDMTNPINVGTMGYVDHFEYDAWPAKDIVMDSVAHTDGDDTPKSYHHMKATALAWCLAQKKFLRMQSGPNSFSDHDPGLLTYLFPHLDPWGIGGFSEQRWSKDQHISFERQVRNLLLQDGSLFQNDNGFAYVCWNIMQKREVNLNASF